MPALEAVLEEVRQANVDLIVFGGDVLPGPMVRETLSRVLHLDTPTQFIHGNGELAVLAQIEAPDPGAVTYWGTVGGAPLPEPFREVIRWTAHRVQPDYTRVLASWPRTVRVEIPGLGSVLFCHATPRNDVDVFTRETPEDVVLPLFEATPASLIVCGHTHMQFDRMIGPKRVVNAGSVGMPFAEPGAYWLLLGTGIDLRRTPYDLETAAGAVRRTQYPPAEEFAARNILNPPSEAEMLAMFSKATLRSSG